MRSFFVLALVWRVFTNLAMVRKLVAKILDLLAMLAYT
jgi:hypothetical protein